METVTFGRYELLEDPRLQKCVNGSMEIKMVARVEDRQRGKS